MQIDSNILKTCWVLAGPTACGKTAASLILAERIGAEIIALDSMSLYRGMDVGTAKATAAEQARVPHHLLDVIEPHEESTVADYVTAADDICREVIGRGHVPLFVGGTGLYLRGVLRGVFPGPPADWTLRRRLQAEAAAKPESLHQRLQAVDPRAAGKLHPNDVRRIIRALEVYELTGRTVSEQQQQQQQPLPAGERPPHVYWLSPPRGWLYERINARVAGMIHDGFADEVDTLLQRPRPFSRTARQALGYRELIDFFEGRGTLDEAVARIQTKTRQFAKRQHTWFRNLEECHEIQITGTESADELVERILIVAGERERRQRT